MLAFLALGYLAAKRVRLPGEMSLVGFDNLPEAFGVGLSSYDFNVHGTVRAMLEHILHYRPRAHERQLGLTEIEGQVMERRTSGPARGVDEEETGAGVVE
jgi:DNA-binding LacI/PurR family transcriptional regulator